MGFFKRFPEHIPLSGCCSASIAAAYQPCRLYSVQTPARELDPDISLQKLKWGVVEDHDQASDSIGHAIFSVEEVTPLVKGKAYA